MGLSSLRSISTCYIIRLIFLIICILSPGSVDGQNTVVTHKWVNKLSQSPKVIADILDKVFNDSFYCAEGMSQTRNNELWLYTNYRALWSFRFSIRKKFNSVLIKGSGDLEIDREYYGTTLFMNWQNITILLDCPCGSKSITWRYYGKGGNKFNKEFKDPIPRKAFRVIATGHRKYYNLYSCEFNGKFHFFHVFTRPIGLTSLPPLTFLEGIPGPSDAKKEIDCDLAMYDKPNLIKVFQYIPAPFQVFWNFPSYPREDPKRDEQSRPSAENGKYNLFWAKQMIGSKQIERLPYDDLNLQLHSGTPRALTNFCDTNPVPQPPSIVLRHTLKITSRFAQIQQAGIYSCMIVDSNGLSSSFWWDGDAPPSENMRGNSHIRVRPQIYVFIALGTFCGICVLIGLCICILPNNKDDFIAPEDDPPPPQANEPTVNQITRPPSVHSSPKKVNTVASVNKTPSKSKSVVSERKPPSVKPIQNTGSGTVRNRKP